jgi:hypothetical protein
MPVDQLISFGLREGFLKPGLQSFPDPRQTFEVPIDVVLVSQILQRLNDEHSLISAPYALNSAELVSELGYNIEILEQGFNNRATFPRETIFHGEVLKHILLASKPESLINWYNRDWLNILRENSPGRTRQYILDGTKIYVPESSWTEYQGAGKVKNQDGTYSYGYKYSNSDADPIAIVRNLVKSASELRPQDSAILVGIDVDALLICEVSPYTSSFGNCLVIK